MADNINHINKKDFLKDIKIVYAVVAFVAVLILLRIGYVMTGRADYLNKRKQDIIANIQDIAPVRGNILDANNNLLATSVPHYEIAFDPCAAKDTLYNNNIDSLCACMHSYFGTKTAEEYKELFTDLRKRKKSYIRLLGSADFTTKSELKEFPIFRETQYKGGFIAKPVSERIRLTQNVMRRAIGYFENDDNVNGAKQPACGLEYSYNKELSGIAGRYRGKNVPNLGFIPDEDGVIYPEVPANDLITSIDIDLQYFAHQALEKQLQKTRAKSGVAVVMEVKTGYIKSMVSLSLVKDTTSEEFKYAENDINRAIGVATAPGSTFKIPVIMAAMEDGLIDLDSIVDTGKSMTHVYFGDEIRDDEIFGKLSVREVIQKSSNLGMAKIVYDKYYLTDKTEQFVQRLKSMGFGSETGIDIDGERLGLIKSPNHTEWKKSTPMRMASGYEMNLTPMQILTFYNAIANDGVMCKPQFATELRSNGLSVHTFKPRITTYSICAKSTLAKIQEVLIGVVEHGTASRIKSNRYKIAGKTGTATIYDDVTGYKVKKYQASFVGYFPADAPKYSCIVMITEPDTETGIYYGSSAAAPVFRQIADELFRKDHEINHSDVIVQDKELSVPMAKNGNREDISTVLRSLGFAMTARNITSDWVKTDEDGSSVKMIAMSQDAGIVPNVREMSAKDAVYLLESLGLRAIATGRGSVKKQSIPEGTKIKKGERIVLSM